MIWVHTICYRDALKTPEDDLQETIAEELILYWFSPQKFKGLTAYKNYQWFNYKNGFQLLYGYYMF